MNKHLIILMMALFFTACKPGRIVQNEAAILPESNKGKWWIINAIVQDVHGKDLHVNSLISLDRAAGIDYASCFTSVWSESNSMYYTGTRITKVVDVQFKNSIPFRLSFPARDSLGMEWSLLVKRNRIQLLTSVNSKESILPVGYTELLASFHKQVPFAVSVISASPQAWAVSPLEAATSITGNISAASPSKIQVRVFTDKEILLKRSESAYVHWLDLDLKSGKHLSILFSTGSNDVVQADAVLLWDENGQIMARPQLILQTSNNESGGASPLTKAYPLFFSIALPGQQVNIKLQPRMIDQEITANKNTYWMGAMEATDSQSGQSAGKGNMYIFKQ